MRPDGKMDEYQHTIEGNTMRQVNVTITVSVPETVADVVSQAEYDDTLTQRVIKAGTAHQIRRAAQMANYQIQSKVRNEGGREY
jgi:hypothetical protein